jgi:acyl-CoA thioester hydrolase
MTRDQFKHSTSVRVRNYEVDWQGIVHNANYLLYFEVGRIEYLKRIGIQLDINTIRKENMVVLVRNEIDYLSPALFDDSLLVYSRVSYIKNTSFAFEGLILHEPSGRLIASNVAIHVWLDARTGEPAPVGANFRRKVREFEGESVAILDAPSLA